MNQSSSANEKKISSPDSSEVFDASPSKTYHEQAYIDQTLRLREILKTLPAFLLPKKPICTRSANGVSFIPIIYPLFFQHQTGPHPFLFLSTCFFLIFQKPDIPSTLIS